MNRVLTLIFVISPALLPLVECQQQVNGVRGRPLHLQPQGGAIFFNGGQPRLIPQKPHRGKGLLPPPPPPPPRRQQQLPEVPEEGENAEVPVKAEARSFDEDVSVLQAPPPNSPQLNGPPVGVLPNGRGANRPHPKLKPPPPVPPKLRRGGRPPRHHPHRGRGRIPPPPLPKRIPHPLPPPSLRRPLNKEEFLQLKTPPFLRQLNGKLPSPDPTPGVPEVFSQPSSPTTTLLTDVVTSAALPVHGHHDQENHQHNHHHNDHQHGGLSLLESGSKLQLLTPENPDTTTSPPPLIPSNSLEDQHDDDHHHHHHHGHKKDDVELDLNLLGPDFKISPRGHSSPVFKAQVIHSSFDKSICILDHHD